MRSEGSIREEVRLILSDNGGADDGAVSVSPGGRAMTLKVYRGNNPGETPDGIAYLFPHEALELAKLLLEARAVTLGKKDEGECEQGKE